jgi:hypothetical protein
MKYKLDFKHKIKVEGDKLFLAVELEVYRYKKDLIGKPKFFTSHDALELVKQEGHSVKNTGGIKKAYNDGRSPNKNTWVFDLNQPKPKQKQKTVKKPAQKPAQKPAVAKEVEIREEAPKKTIKEPEPPSKEAKSTHDILASYNKNRKK